MKKFLKIFVLVVLILGVVGGGIFCCWHFLGRKNDGAFSTLRYVALGDSITYAMDGTNGGLRMDKPYCDVVGDILGFRTVSNHGISGSTVSHAENYSSAPYCERFQTMPDADVVSVLGGANDIMNVCTLGQFGDEDAKTFYGALDILAKGLKEKYPNAFIFFMTPLKISFVDGVEDSHAAAEKYRLAIKQVCAKYDLPVLDTYVLCDFSQEYGAIGYAGDGLHPSQEFHKNTLAPVIAQFIKENLQAS